MTLVVYSKTSSTPPPSGTPVTISTNVPSLALSAGTPSGTVTGTPKNFAGSTATAPVVYQSSNVAVATVDAYTGVVTRVGAGSCTITCIIDVSPVYNAASQTLVDADNMDSYTTSTAMGALPSGGAMRIVPNPSPIATTTPVNTLANIVITGRGGVGKALRLVFPGTDQSGPNWYLYQVPALPTGKTHYFEFWRRMTMDSTPGPAAIHFKDFLVWLTLDSSNRTQWNTGSGSSSSPVTGWECLTGIEQAIGDGTDALQPLGPLTADIFHVGTPIEVWHQTRYEWRPNSANGARDGFARMYIDGLMVGCIDVGHAGVYPEGNYGRPWCYLTDVDNLPSTVNERPAFVAWGATQTGASPPWTYDMDDFLWWWGA